MAHPSKNLPKNLYYVSTADELVAPEGRHFFSVTSLDGGTVALKGGGMFQYLGASSSSPAATGFIDPSTGKAFLSNNNAAGHYEALPATSVQVVLAAGQTVFGRFSSVTGASNKEFLVYA